MRFAQFLLFFLLISCNSSNGERFLPSNLKSAKIVAIVDYKFEGCFGGAAHKLLIVDNNGQKNAILTSDDGSRDVAKLNDAQVDSFYQFVKELKEIDFSFGCTTTSYYDVSLGIEKIKKTDGGCDWDGFDKLRTCLFNE